MTALASITKQLSMATAMLGKPDDRNSIVFAGPPEVELLSEDDRNIYPIGMLASITTRDSRQGVRHPVIGSDIPVSLGYQKGPKVGAISGLTLFVEDKDLSIKDYPPEEARTHFLKSLYADARKFSPELIKLFYASSDGQATSGLEPVAYNDSDRWRNFTSQLFSTPIGLYKLERSEGGATLEATYYENVELEGQHQLGIQAGAGMGPQFEQFSFTYSKAVPQKPSTDFVTENIAGESGSLGGGASMSTFLHELKRYLGVEQ